jgi:hypothetical protein
MTAPKANCILLNVKGRYYYAEEFGNFIEIEQWEYDRILNDPHLYYFSTALKKHFEWCAAVGKTMTVTFSDALERQIGRVDAHAASPALSAPPSLSSTVRVDCSKTPRNRVLGTVVALVFAAILILILSTSKTPNASTPEQTKTTSVHSSAGDVAEYARKLTEQATATVESEPEIRKAIAVQSMDVRLSQRPELEVPEGFGTPPIAMLSTDAKLQREQEEWHWEEIQLHKWDHYTTEGKTFMIAVFKERHLGDRKLEVDAAARQIRAQFYRMWDHHKIGNLEEVRIVFYKTKPDSGTGAPQLGASLIRKGRASLRHTDSLP